MRPAELIAEGKTLLKKGSYLKAERVFRKFAEKFPNSNYMDVAIMGQGDAIYKQGDRYLEADFQYLNFTELYPVHPNVDRAYFYKGMCSYKQMEVYNRDQTNTLDALKNFELVIREFPKSKYSRKAKKLAVECRTILAKNLFYVGKYYFEIRAHQSTILRMRELLKKYPKFDSNDEAFYLVGESYYREENFEKAAKVFREFIRRYPRSKFRGVVNKRMKRLRRFQ